MLKPGEGLSMHSDTVRSDSTQTTNGPTLKCSVILHGAFDSPTEHFKDPCCCPTALNNYDVLQ